MRNKYFRLLIVSVLAVALFVGLVYVQRQAVEFEITENVMVFSRNLVRGEEITEKDLTYISIPVTQIIGSYIKDSDEIVGLYAGENLSRGQIVKKDHLSSTKLPGKNELGNERMIALKLDIDQAAAWQIELDEEVEILFMPDRYDEGEDNPTYTDGMRNEKKITAKVVDIFNDALVSVNEPNYAGTPHFVLIQASEEDTAFIARVKGLGRFEFTIK